MKKKIITCCCLLASMLLVAAPAAKPAKGGTQKGGGSKAPSSENLPKEYQGGNTTKTTAETFGPVRTKPVYRGEFQVDLVVIAFPDCEQPESPQAVREALSSLGSGSTISDYYKDYSQDITWPVLDVYPAVYVAPQPLGYYCRWDYFNNRIGYKGGGGERARQLREDALRFVQSKGRPQRKGVITCYVYCRSVSKDMDVIERTVRKLYPPKPSPEALARGVVDPLAQYAPKVHWADPLWPNSIPQVAYPADGGTLVHELGHVLGAPDFYHATEEHDGLPGTPCLPWSHGPTGPAYCRYIYHAFVPAGAYPKVTKPGEYTIAPRSARFPMTGGDGLRPLGLLVPSSHPNYIFCIEYCHDEKPPVGNPSAEGLLVHVINVTMTSPMLGPPDLCYTYRAGDKDHKALGSDGTYLKDGDSFDDKSDPAAILPNLMPAGIAISAIKIDGAAGTCTFKLDFPEVKATRQELAYSLLPQTELVTIDSIMPTSFRVEMNVMYRGEPLLTEYGFCYGTKKDPTEGTGTMYPLYHRDRYDARIIDLKPGTMYYVRGYARNASGIRYSRNQKGVTLPQENPIGEPTLLLDSDKLKSNWYFQQYYFGEKDGLFVSANPLFAMMAIAGYYREMPGSATGKATFELTRVHSNPAGSRPRFRLREVDLLRPEIETVLKAAGLRQGDFKPIWDSAAKDEGKGGKKKGTSRAARPVSSRTSRKKQPAAWGNHTEWVEKCAAALKLKNPEEVFFNCPTEEALVAKKDEIRRWILMSQPVLIVRQNRPLEDDISQRWPLDIAIIDGLGFDSETFHVVFPGGCDRGRRGVKDGYMRLGELLYRTSDAMLMFYRPGPVPSGRKGSKRP